MIESPKALQPHQIVERVNFWLRRAPNPNSQEITEVNGAITIFEGHKYRSRIERATHNKGVDAYRAKHKYDTSQLWDSGCFPDAQITRSYELMTFDQGERVVLQVQVVKWPLISDELRLNLVRGGMVFPQAAIPNKEQRRMIELFSL
jgi:hypothetical protein